MQSKLVDVLYIIEVVARFDATPVMVMVDTITTCTAKLRVRGEGTLARSQQSTFITAY